MSEVVVESEMWEVPTELITEFFYSVSFGVVGYVRVLPCPISLIQHVRYG